MVKIHKGETVLTLNVVPYSKVKTREDFIEIFNSLDWDPPIDMELDTQIGTLNEYYREFGIRRYIVKGDNYELEVYKDDSVWKIIGEVDDMNHEGKPIEIQEKEKEGLTEYGKMLYDEGLPVTRIPDLIKGIDKIHGAISRLDYPNLKIWVSKSIEERMEDWAPTAASRSIKKTLEAGNII